MILTKKVVANDIKYLGLERLLDIKKVKEVVLSKNKDSLRDLIFYVVEELHKSNIEMENYYYGKYVAMSNGLFDMFDMRTITELFKSFGYSCIEDIQGEFEDWETVDKGYLAGKLYIIKGDTKFETNIYHSMHDSRISMFIDTKEFIIQ